MKLFGIVFIPPARASFGRIHPAGSEPEDEDLLKRMPRFSSRFLPLLGKIFVYHIPYLIQPCNSLQLITRNDNRERPPVKIGDTA